jgi:hypothetical protein
MVYFCSSEGRDEGNMNISYLHHFNELFVIISFIGAIIIIKKLPSLKIPISLIILVCLFSANLARISDSILAAPNFDLYDIMSSEKFNVFDFFTYLLYCPFGYLFIYFYEKWSLKGYQIIWYIVLASIGGTLYEWIAHLFGVFEYKKWDIRFSFAVYLFVQPLSLLFYEWIKNTHGVLIKRYQ